MKTVRDIIFENIDQLNILDLLSLESIIIQAKSNLIQELKNLGSYPARKLLMKSGLTHSEACQFIKKYIH